MTSRHDDERLLAEFKATFSRASLLALLKAYQDRIYNLCFQVVGRAEDAEDAAQATLMKVSDGARTATDADAFAGWIYRVSIRSALDVWRRRETARRHERRSAMTRPSTVPFEDPERRALFEALERLPDSERTLVVQHYFEKLSLDELGARNGLSGMAIWKRLDKIREKLKRLLLAGGFVSLSARFVEALEASVPITAPSTRLAEAAMAKALLEGVAVGTAKGLPASAWVMALALLLIIAVGGYVFLRPSGNSASSAAPSSKSGAVTGLVDVQRRQPAEEEAPPTPLPTVTTIIREWSEVPCRYAAFPAMIGGKGRERRTSYASLANKIRWESKVFPDGDKVLDRELRFLGVIQTLDGVLVDLLGLPRKNGWYCWHDPKEYFPLDFGLPQLPEDPAESNRILDRLLAMLSTGEFGETAARVPSQHRFEGLEEALATRAVSMLGAWDSDARSRELLRSLLRKPGVDSRKVAALNALVMQGETAEAGSWLESIKDDTRSLAAVADGLTPPNERMIPHPEADSAVLFMSAQADQGRELDGVIVDLYYTSTHTATRASLAASLAGRVDNDRVRQVALDILKTGEPEAIVSLLRQRPALHESVEYAAALKALLFSADPRVVSWAIIGLSTSSDPEAWRSIAHLLQHPNRGIALIAVSSFGRSARSARAECQVMIRTAMEGRRGDSEFENMARLTLLSLN